MPKTKYGGAVTNVKRKRIPGGRSSYSKTTRTKACTRTCGTANKLQPDSVCCGIHRWSRTAAVTKNVSIMIIIRSITSSDIIAHPNQHVPVFTWTDDSTSFSLANHQTVTSATNVLLARRRWAYRLHQT